MNKINVVDVVKPKKKRKSKYATPELAAAARKAYLKKYARDHPDNQKKYAPIKHRNRRILTITKKPKDEILSALEIIIKDDPDFKKQLANLLIEKNHLNK